MTHKAHIIPTENAKIVILSAPRGFIMCGYLNIDVAERLGDAAAIVTGIETENEALSAKIVAATSAAKALGIEVGMSGEEALCLLQ